MSTTQLMTTQLGTTRTEIARIGCGAWAIGGGGWEAGWGQVDPILTGAGIDLTAEDIDQIERSER